MLVGGCGELGWYNRQSGKNVDGSNRVDTAVKLVCKMGQMRVDESSDE